MEPGRKVGGVISIKHVYEIAKYKNEELNCASYSLKEMCQNVINVANRTGIKIVHNDLNPAELREFLDERKRHEEINYFILSIHEDSKKWVFSGLITYGWYRINSIFISN